MTLHINRESRLETLKSYKLAIRDVTLFEPCNFHPSLPTEEDLRRKITTWWCFDPAKDLFQIEGFRALTCCFTMVRVSFRSPALMDNIMHIQWRVDDYYLWRKSQNTSTTWSLFGQWTFRYLKEEALSFVHLRSLNSFTIFVPGVECSPMKDPSDLFRNPIWLSAASFHVFFTALAKLDPPRKIPKIFLKLEVITIPSVVEPNLESLKKLPHNAYLRSDLSREEKIESIVVELLRTFEERKIEINTPSQAVRYFQDVVNPITWKDAAMGFVGPLKWDSSYVEFGGRPSSYGVTKVASELAELRLSAAKLSSWDTRE